MKHEYALTSNEIDEVLSGKKTALVFPVLPSVSTEIKEWFEWEGEFFGYIKQKYGQEASIVSPFGIAGSIVRFRQGVTVVSATVSSVEIVRLENIVKGTTPLTREQLVYPENETFKSFEFNEKDWFWIISFSLQKNAY